MKIKTFCDWVNYEHTQNEINDFLQNVDIIDIKIAMSDNHEMMVVMYKDK